MKDELFSDFDRRAMLLALEEAKQAAEEGEIPIGAVIYCQGRLLAKAHNLVERLQDPTAHAEMLAISQAVEAIGAKYLAQCTLYVTVEPCLMCAAASRWAQVGELIYAIAEPKVGYSQFAHNALHPKCKLRSGLMADEAKALMQTFFKGKRTPKS